MLEFEAIKSHRYKRVLENWYLNPLNGFYLTDNTSNLPAIIVLITFSVLITQGLFITWQSMYFLISDRWTIILVVIFPFYAFMTILRMFNRFDKWRINSFIYQLHYWCRLLLKDGIIQYVIDPHFLYNHYRSVSTRSSFFTMLNLNQISNKCVTNYRFEDLLVSFFDFKIFRSLLTRIGLKKYKNRYLSTLKSRVLFDFVYIVVLILDAFWAFSVIQVSFVREHPNFFILMVTFTSFLLILYSVYFFINRMIFNQSDVYALKSVIYIVFFRDPNNDFSILNYSKVHNHIEYQQVVNVINTYLYPEQKIDKNKTYIQGG